jgi:cytochrome oxidase assembly protein ShyY1
MKRFDFAADVAKQLITISSAFIAVVVAFYEKFFTRSPVTFFFVVLVLITFIVSIVAGVWSLGGLVTLVSRQERLDQATQKGRLPSRPVFVSLRGTEAMRYAQLQQWVFLFAMVGFALVALIDNFTK